MKAQFYNAWIGGSSGVFKGVCALEKCNVVVKNLDSLKSATNKNPVTSMSWTNESEEEILIGYGSQLVKVYNIQSRLFTSTHELKCGEGPIVGVSKFNGAFVTAIESGTVKLWNDGSSVVFQAGTQLERMRQCPLDRHIIATGGKENDLKLWDIQTAKQTFNAKNVRHDNLEMRVPIWVTDICYLTDTRKVAVTTRHGHVRLYDPLTNARRPVVNVLIPEQSLTSISTSIKDQNPCHEGFIVRCFASNTGSIFRGVEHRDVDSKQQQDILNQVIHCNATRGSLRSNHVIVGSGTGQMNLVDLRSKGLVMNKYKGFTGSIKAIACPEENPYIVSVSLDRHLRIHNLHTKELLFKEYVQSKMTCVLIKKDFNLTYARDSDDDTIPNFPEVDSIPPEKDHGTSSDEYEEMFKHMPTVGDKRPKISNTSRKKHKAN